MIIKQMTAYFGALEGRTLTLSDGLNVLYAPNESGKSTWCAFLRTMLYGLDTSQRARAGGQPPDKLKYRPWSGAPMSGSMELETKDGPVTLRRWTERASRPMQAFSATRTGTDLPVPGLAPDTAGQTLTGMPRQVFERSVFIRQSALPLTNDPELDRRLGAIVSSGDESVSYIEAQTQLMKWQRRRRSGKRGAIPELERKLDETRRKLEDVRRCREEAARIDGELDELEARRADAAADERRRLEARREKALSDVLEAQERVARARARRGEAERAREEADAALDATPYGHAGPEEAAARTQGDIDAASELTRQAEKRPRRWLAYIPLGMAAPALALSLVLPPRAVWIAAGAVLALASGVLLARMRGMERARQAALEELADLLERRGVDGPEQLGVRLERYQALWQAREQAARDLEEAGRALSDAEEALRLAQETARDGGGETGGEAGVLAKRIDDLRRQRAMAEGRAAAIGDPMALESALAEADARRAELLEQEAALALALEALAEADAQLQQRFSPALAKTAAGFFSDMTGGRYDEITLARDLTAKARPAGEAVGRELDYLSSGAQDQLYLSLRLALCTLLPGQEEDACPIVLDDALAAFDAGRMAKALALLKELAGTRQILLFTCHEREYRYFERGGAACQSLAEPESERAGVSSPAIKAGIE